MAPTMLMFFFVVAAFNFSEGSNRYWLYDRSVKNWTEIDVNGTVPKGVWNREHPVKVLVHGYNGNSLPIMQLLDVHFMNILAREYAKYDRFLNIIAVDWAKLADNPAHKYADSVKNVKPAGDQIAEFFVKMLKNEAFNHLKYVHFLGISMGAHVAGAVGYTIERLTNGDKLGRITGLDPAGPMFSGMIGKKPVDMRIVLDYEDADFVDVVHTNQGTGTGTVLKGKLGTMLEVAHIDFYPNGGETQTDQCTYMNDRIDFCSHQASVLFYAYSLRRPKKYIGCRCHDYVRYLKKHCECDYPASGQPLGDLARPAQRGRYYLTITDPITPDTFKS